MPSDQTRSGPATPMGAEPVPGGCTFRCWAPRAEAVWVAGSFNGWSREDEACRLVNDGRGFWSGFVPGVEPGASYKFLVRGSGSTGWKRDPYAREIVAPDWNCIVLDPGHYPWHDAAFRTPAFEELIIYQLHVGTFSALGVDGSDRRPGRVAKFLDVADRLPHLVELGVTAVQMLPIVEYPTEFSLGYNGTDYFSPEFDYAVSNEELPSYLARANALLADRGYGPVAPEHVASAAGQLRLLVDLLHVHGIALLFDVVYNHAGGDFGDESLYFFDRMPAGNNNDSLYFTSEGWAGGLIFAYWNASVRQYLIDNAVFMIKEFHVDGLRYDEASVIDRYGGWHFCQDLSGTLRFAKPSIVQIAEYWGSDQTAAVRPVGAGGAGFDLVWHAGLRESVHRALAQAAGGRDALVDLGQVAEALGRSAGFDAAWRMVQMLENHDLLLASHAPHDQRPRVVREADPSNPRSWYARSRARVAMGWLLSGPGIPQLFMGQEFLEDKFWSDHPGSPSFHIWWNGLSQDRVMVDFLRFTRELIAVRRDQEALRRGRINVFHTHDVNRVLAYHRWMEGRGLDLVIVTSLAEETYARYGLGFPAGGPWREIFNSDVYDGWVNPAAAGNGGRIVAEGPPMHGLPTSAEIVLPANAIVIFART
ncbi:alpha amylase C-terminal domain-containing protein [Methylorubrum extorquens]|uniref:alpha amylase C-terminal domain-containing protein n=1 Tax=Methylorubrum extorquens TaxID=408 RepID=UPI001EE525AB|nr:alpha amylase C-terminal domain-containing protein [Methylorubrum extorquens]MCG5248417.1 alpha amylase C-terminal domain-containing protein [Methylorubrum extorquens]